MYQLYSSSPLQPQSPSAQEARRRRRRRLLLRLRRRMCERISGGEDAAAAKLPNKMHHLVFRVKGRYMLKLDIFSPHSQGTEEK